jgi:hypothetical protein
MHMQGEPRTMQQSRIYGDVVRGRGLPGRAVRGLQAAGIARTRIVLDPGFGFGKTLAHNLLLLRALPRFARGRIPRCSRAVAQVDARTLTGRRSVSGWRQPWRWRRFAVQGGATSSAPTMWPAYPRRLAGWAAADAGG